MLGVHEPILARAGTLACALLATISIARAEPLEVTLQFDSFSPRSFAPIPATLTFDWQGAGLLKGRLRIDFREANMPLLCYETEPLTLTSGKRTLRVLLPQPHKVPMGTGVFAYLAFVTKDRTITLPPESVQLHSSWQFHSVIAIVSANHDNDALQEFWRAYRLERALSSEAARLDGLRMSQIATWPAQIPPKHLPTTPYALCGYDMVILHEAGLEKLNSRQLEALTQWMRAGGNIICVPGSAVLRKEHLAFLEAVANKPNGEAVAVGLGKMLRYDILPDKAALKKWVTFEHRQDWWSVKSTPIDGTSIDSSNLAMKLTERGSTATTAIAEFLLPRELRIISIPVLISSGLLLAFIVGPFDWWLLKKLKRRLFTWITFPLWTIAFTAGLLVAANSFLGANATRSITVTDVDASNRPLRASRFEIDFHNKPRDIQSAASGSLVSLSGATNTNRLRNRPQATSFPCFSGRLPGDYQIAYSSKKWVPQMKRFFTFPKKDSLSHLVSLEMEWPDLRDLSDSHLRKELANLQNQIPEAVFVYYHRSQTNAPVVSPRIADDTLALASAVISIPPPRRQLPPWDNGAQPGAPRGGMDLIDFQEPARPQLLIIFTQDDHYHIIRHFYELES